MNKRTRATEEMRSTARIGYKTKCNVCGKRIRMICASDEWVYKLLWRGKPKYYCSWTCFRKAEAEWERQKHENMMNAGRKSAETKRRMRLEQAGIS